MKDIKCYLLVTTLFVSVVRCHGNDLSAKPEVAVKYGNSEGLGSILTSLLQGRANVSLVGRVYKMAERWMDSAPEFKALALAEINKKPGQERGVLDYLADVADYGARSLLENVDDAVTEEADEGRKTKLRHVGLPFQGGANSVVQVVPNLAHYVPHSRIGISHAKSKKHLLKVYGLAKLFIYGFIAKAKIAIILFKITLLVKLKFLAVAVVYTLISLAKLNFQWKTQHIPQLVSIVNPYQQQHQQTNYGHYGQQQGGYGYGGYGGYGGGGYGGFGDGGWFGGGRQYEHHKAAASHVTNSQEQTVASDAGNSLEGDYHENALRRRGVRGSQRFQRRMSVTSYSNPSTRPLPAQDRTDETTTRYKDTTFAYQSTDPPFMPMDPKRGRGRAQLG